MNKKIKVIELLNKRANNEKMPSKIRFGGLSYEYMGSSYYDRDGDLLCENCDLLCELDNEVEILEDEEIDIQDIDIIRDYRTSDDDLYNDNFGDFKSIINDLVRAVKQLDWKINKEG